MVESQLAARGITDPRVLAAMGAVPRERFLSPILAPRAYDDGPLPIGEEQTISQPYIVALMAQALGLAGGERVLEIGAGSGYAAAILGEIAGEVVTVERHPTLARKASRRLTDLGYANVEVVVGDGSRGWPARAPYDAIVVAAGAPAVPASLAEQLAEGGRLVIPVGRDRSLQELLRVTRLPAAEGGGGLREERLGGVRFVPLVGDEGWNEER